jgi:DNA-binding beta-propeller fold protein YncE
VEDPCNLYFTADGRSLLVSCEFSGWVVRVDLESLRVSGELHVGGQPVDVKLSPDGTVMYVANQSRTGRLLHAVPVGKGPHGLDFFPQPGRYSLGHTGNYR